MKDTKIAENEKATFFENNLTKSMTVYADSLSLKCIVAEQKEGGSKDYVLVDKEGKPVYTSTSYEAIGVRIDVLKRLKLEDE